MSLSWPWALPALLVIPLVFAVGWLARRRRFTRRACAVDRAYQPRLGRLVRRARAQCREISGHDIVGLRALALLLERLVQSGRLQDGLLRELAVGRDRVENSRLHKVA